MFFLNCGKFFYTTLFWNCIFNETPQTNVLLFILKLVFQLKKTAANRQAVRHNQMKLTWPVEVLEINYVHFWRYWHCWVTKNVSTQLCLKELYKCSKSPLHSLNLPALNDPGNCHALISAESKMKPAFTAYLFHCWKSITFVYTPYYILTSLWQFSYNKREFSISPVGNRYSCDLYHLWSGCKRKLAPYCRIGS